jgi:cytochrome bd-type quinol oxidase subunit 1
VARVRLLRTRTVRSPTVHSGTALFTLIGFCGLYLVLGCCSCSWIGREIRARPAGRSAAASTRRRLVELWYCIAA